MTRNRPYIIEYIDLGVGDGYPSKFQLRVEGSSNADARTAFKQQMKAEFGIVEGRNYQINSVTLDRVLKVPPESKAKTTSKMGLKEAEGILGNRARWEVVNMKKALSSMQMLNTDEENKRLEACKVWLRSHKR